MLGQALQFGWGQVKQNVPLALGGLAVGAGLGFLASRGRPSGAVEGMIGVPIGASTGAFSGAVLGAGVGAGLLGLGMAVPGVRPAVGSFLTSILSSRPVQSLGRGAAIRLFEAGMKRGARGEPAVLGAAKLHSFLGKFAAPHQEAANFMIQMLERKRASLMYGAVAGGGVGVVAGLGFGGLRGAWQAGARLRGPMESTY